MRLNKNGLVLAAVLSLALTGCAVDRHERRAAVKGALIGAAGGAAISALTGADVAAGAAIGAAGGAAVGVITQDGRERRVRHEGGRRYWQDDDGRRRYLPDGYR
jgi:osmotically inducible lipoprotein OsmB